MPLLSFAKAGVFLFYSFVIGIAVGVPIYCDIPEIAYIPLGIAAFHSILEIRDWWRV